MRVRASVAALALACVQILGCHSSAPSTALDAFFSDASVDAYASDAEFDAALDASHFDLGYADAGAEDAASDMAHGDAAGPPRWVTHSSLVHSAGGSNAAAVDPFDPNLLLTAGDVSGVHRSENRGADFANTSMGLSSEDELNGVCLVYSTLEPGLVFYLAGNRGEPDSAGLFVSHDGGQEWLLRSRDPTASASDNPRSGDLANEPRLVGQQLALDERVGDGGAASRRILYVGTYDAGLLRSNDDGASFHAVALPDWPTPAYVVGLHLGPAIEGVRSLFVGVKREGIWRVTIDDATGEIVASVKLTGSPNAVEEISGNAHVLAVAAGADGAYLSTDDGATFVQAALEPAFSDGVVHGRWTAVAVQPATSLESTKIWLGCYSLSDRRCTTSLARSNDGGTTWRNGAAGPLSDPLTFADSTEVYWQSRCYSQENPNTAESLLGSRNFKAYQIALAPGDPSAVYVAANGVTWRTLDDGATWAPIGRGVGATVAVSVAHAPYDDGDEIFGMYDWSVALASPSVGPLAWHRPAQDTRTGRAFAYEPLDVAGRWVMALSLQDNGAAGATLGGSVWTSTPALRDDPPLTATWIDEELDLTTDGRVVGVAVGRDASGQRVLLASVANGSAADRARSTHACNARTTSVGLGCAGVFRKVGSGAWTQVLSAPDLLATSSAKAPFVWRSGSYHVYFLDARRGLFVSRDSGASFTEIRDYRDGLGGAWGYLAESASALSSTVFASRRAANAERVDVVDDGLTFTTTVHAWTLPGDVRVGPLGVSTDGAVYAASLADSAHHADLWRSIDGIEPFVTISDHAYRSQAIVPTDLAVAPSGRISVSCWGTGFVEVEREAP